MLVITATLLALQATRRQAEALEVECKELEAPHKAAIEKATKERRAELRTLREAEATLAATAAGEYVTAAAARAQAMAARPDHPPPAVPLPTGCAVRWLTRLEVTDPDLLPRFVLMVDEKAAKEALAAALDVPGAKLTQTPSFQFAKETSK